MQITITDNALLIIGLLAIAFLPHIYLFLIFAMMCIADLIEYTAKLLYNLVNLLIDYVFPVAITSLLYLAILHIFVLVLKSIILSHFYV